jgi:hypothetical protein
MGFPLIWEHRAGRVAPPCSRRRPRASLSRSHAAQFASPSALRRLATSCLPLTVCWFSRACHGRHLVEHHAVIGSGDSLDAYLFDLLALGQAESRPTACLLYVCSAEVDGREAQIAVPLTPFLLDGSVAQRRGRQALDTVIYHHRPEDARPG